MHDKSVTTISRHQHLVLNSAYSITFSYVENIYSL